MCTVEWTVVLLLKWQSLCDHVTAVHAFRDSEVGPEVDFTPSTPVRRLKLKPNCRQQRSKTNDFISIVTLNMSLQQDLMAQTCNPSTWELKAGGFKVNLVYVVRPVSKRKEFVLLFILMFKNLACLALMWSRVFFSVYPCKMRQIPLQPQSPFILTTSFRYCHAKFQVIPELY